MPDLVIADPDHLLLQHQHQWKVHFFTLLKVVKN